MDDYSFFFYRKRVEQMTYGVNLVDLGKLKLIISLISII